MKFKVDGEKVSADGDVVGGDSELIEANDPAEAIDTFYKNHEGGTSTWFVTNCERETDGEEE